MSLTLSSIIADPILVNDPKSELASFTEILTNGESRISGHGGHIDLWINVLEPPAAYAIVRKKKE